MTKREIEHKINQLQEQINKRSARRDLTLFEPDFRSHFVQAVMIHGDNGSQIHTYLNGKGISVSYKTVHEYIRRLFGKYTSIGRPPKYYNNNSSRKKIG